MLLFRIKNNMLLFSLNILLYQRIMFNTYVNISKCRNKNRTKQTSIINYLFQFRVHNCEILRNVILLEKRNLSRRGLEILKLSLNWYYKMFGQYVVQLVTPSIKKIGLWFRKRFQCLPCNHTRMRNKGNNPQRPSWYKRDIGGILKNRRNH